MKSRKKSLEKLNEIFRYKDYHLEFPSSNSILKIQTAKIEFQLARRSAQKHQDLHVYELLEPKQNSDFLLKMFGKKFHQKLKKFSKEQVQEKLLNHWSKHHFATPNLFAIQFDFLEFL